MHIQDITSAPRLQCSRLVEQWCTPFLQGAESVLDLWLPGCSHALGPLGQTIKILLVNQSNVLGTGVASLQEFGTRIGI